MNMNMYLALGAAKKKRHLTARTYAMRFPNGRHPSMNVKRRFDQRLRDKKM
jgi:hypothetical protein